MASASELEYLLLLTTELGMLPPHTYAVLESQVKEVKRMLTSLIQRMRSDVTDEEKGKRRRPPSDLIADG